MIDILHCVVNGKAVEVPYDPRESLADTLRQRLGLTSVKKGCEVGECGACNVLIDGECFNSCIYLAVWADGKDILTLEGLAGAAEENTHGVLCVPEINPMFQPSVTLIPLQLFAYYMALSRGCDVDKPRNLAKSVTVE